VPALRFAERPASGEAAGLLVLHHGRGSDEQDMLALGEALDPARRLHLVAPRGPLRLGQAPGWHWYLVPRVGYPDRDTFFAAYQQLAGLHDELWQRTGIAPAHTVLGGFSMGTVMSYALALGAERPAPGGILAFSGFIPSVEGWRAHLEDRAGTAVFIAHGRNDPVIDVEFARRARQELEAGALDVSYRESDGAHNIDARQLDAARQWLGARLDAWRSAQPR
jgi:phospholipase/carboxylesterase